MRADGDARTASILELVPPLLPEAAQRLQALVEGIDSLNADGNIAGNTTAAHTARSRAAETSQAEIVQAHRSEPGQPLQQPSVAPANDALQRIATPPATPPVQDGIEQNKLSPTASRVSRRAKYATKLQTKQMRQAWQLGVTFELRLESLSAVLMAQMMDRPMNTINTISSSRR